MAEPKVKKSSNHLRLLALGAVPVLLTARLAAQGEPDSALRLADSLLSKSELEAHLEPALVLLDESASVIQSFLRSKPAMALAARARRSLDFRIHRKASRAAQAAFAQAKSREGSRREDDARQLAANLYDAAVLHYQERARDLRKAKDSSEDNELTEVLLDNAKALLEEARIDGLDDNARKSALSQAVALLEDFQYDYGDESASFEALWLEGLCHMELGSFLEAQDRFLGAISLTARLRAAKKEPNEYQVGLVRSAHVSLAESYLQSGQAREALQLVDRILQEDPSIEGQSIGLSLKLQKAEAMFQIGDLAGAQAIASEVLNADPNGRAGAASREKMHQWSADAKFLGKVATPAQLMIRANGLVMNESWLEALGSLRNVIDICQAGEERLKHQPEAWFLMGDCYAHMGRNYEAVFAFERILQEFGESPLAPRACYESVRALGSEFAAFGEREDEAHKEELLALLVRRWPEHPVSRNIPFLQAEKLEKQGNLLEAAKAFLKVPQDADAFENALVSAARCHYRHGCALWDTRAKEPAAADDARVQLTASAEVLKRFLEHTQKPAFLPKNAEATQQRASLLFLATQQLALVYSHDAMGKYEEALTCLERYASTCKDNARLARILGMKVRPLLATGKGEAAVETVEALFDRFPECPSIVAASKSVAFYLEGVVEELITRSGDSASTDPAIAETLRKIHKYHMKWVGDSAAKRQGAGAAEILAVARTLQKNARRLNGSWDDKNTLVLSPGGVLPEPRFVSDAASIFQLVVEGKLGPLDQRSQIDAALSLARSEGLLARDSAGWDKAKIQYLGIVTSRHLLGADGMLVPAALNAFPGALISAYLELGVVHEQQGKAGQGPSFDAALAVFQNVQKATAGGSEPWWLAKYLTIRSLIERGTPGDLRAANVILEKVQTINPDHDRDKFGMRTRLKEMGSRL